MWIYFNWRVVNVNLVGGSVLEMNFWREFIIVGELRLAMFGIFIGGLDSMVFFFKYCVLDIGGFGFFILKVFVIVNGEEYFI